MNTMNIPGFTAEASFYKTRGYYQLAAGWPNVTGGQPGIPQQAIIPQRIKLRCWDCVCDAFDNCTCKVADCY